MDGFKVCFIGLGSIGKRHLVNMAELLTDMGKSFKFDVCRSGHGGSVGNEVMQYVQNIYYQYEDLPDDYDIIFITNPTGLHYETMKQVVSKTRHMFIEKPVFDKEEDIGVLNLRQEGIYYVACPMRYKNVIQYLKYEVDLSQVYSARAICSSYLPDWRPGTDYRNTYSAQKSQGGGVSIDLIHEWDYLIYLFGEPEQCYNIRGKYSNLEIDTEDLSVYLGKYKDKLVELHLDYFGRKRIREIQIFTKDDTIVGDLENNSVHFLKENQKIQFDEVRDEIQKRELRHFLDMIYGHVENDNNIALALSTLKCTEGCDLS